MCNHFSQRRGIRTHAAEIALRSQGVFMRKPLLVFLLLACATASLPEPADKDKDSPAPEKDAKEVANDVYNSAMDDEIKLPPFPADMTVAQNIVLDGHPLKY